MNLRYLFRLSVLLPMLAALPAGAALPTVPSAAAAPIPSLGVTAFLQAGLGLAAVIALIFLCAWAARRFGLQQHASSRLVKVVASTMVGQRERVVVVQIGASWLVLGVTPGQIRSLHTMPAEDLPAGPAASDTASSAFSLKLRESISKLRRSN